MKRLTLSLVIILLMSISSYSQAKQIQQIITSSGDTAYIIPLWRIINANRQFILLNKTLETNSALNGIIKYKTDKLAAATNLFTQVTKDLAVQKGISSIWEAKFNNQTKQTDIKEIEIKDYKKKVRILKFTIAGVSIVAVGVIAAIVVVSK